MNAEQRKADTEARWQAYLNIEAGRVADARARGAAHLAIIRAAAAPAEPDNEIPEVEK